MTARSKPEIRCSSLDRLLNCNGSITVLDMVPPPPSGVESVLGSALHWETAWRIVKELGASQPEGGLKRGDIPAGYKIPGFYDWVVGWFFDIAKDQIGPTDAVEVETDLRWEFDHFILTGHEDLAITSADGKRGQDNDWKTGRIPVLPSDVNRQVQGYMALRRLIYGVDQLRFSICQPFNDEEQGYERVSSVELEGAALDRNVANLESDIMDALSRPMLLNTGPTQCKYCVGRRCPAIHSLKDKMKLTLTPEMLATLKAAENDQALVDFVLDAKTLARPIDMAEDDLKARLEVIPMLSGSEGTQVRLQEQNAGYSVTDSIGMYRWLQENVKPEHLAPALSYPSTKIKDALAVSMDIPKGGKGPVTAKSVFEGAAAQFLTPKTRKTLIIS